MILRISSFGFRGTGSKGRCLTPKDLSLAGLTASFIIVARVRPNAGPLHASRSRGLSVVFEKFSRRRLQPMHGKFDVALDNPKISVKNAQLDSIVFY